MHHISSVLSGRAIFRGSASAWCKNGVEHYDDALLVQGNEEGINGPGDLRATCNPLSIEQRQHYSRFLQRHGILGTSTPTDPPRAVVSALSGEPTVVASTLLHATVVQDMVSTVDLVLV